MNYFGISFPRHSEVITSETPLSCGSFFDSSVLRVADLLSNSLIPHLILLTVLYLQSLTPVDRQYSLIIVILMLLTSTCNLLKFRTMKYIKINVS